MRMAPSIPDPCATYPPPPCRSPGGGGAGGPSLGQHKIFRCSSLCCCVALPLVSLALMAGMCVYGGGAVPQGGGGGPSLGDRPPGRGGGPSSLGWGTTWGGGYSQQLTGHEVCIVCAGKWWVGSDVHPPPPGGGDRRLATVPPTSGSGGGDRRPWGGGAWGGGYVHTSWRLTPLSWIECWDRACREGHIVHCILRTLHTPQRAPSTLRSAHFEHCAPPTSRTVQCTLGALLTPAGPPCDGPAGPLSLRRVHV